MIFPTKPGRILHHFCVPTNPSVPTLFELSNGGWTMLRFIGAYFTLNGSAGIGNIEGLMSAAKNGFSLNVV